jgi:PST family polysaccharide transporter
MMGGNILTFFNRRTDDFLIGYFLGPVALGYYTVAYRLLLIMTQLWGQIVGSVAFPAFSCVQKELERLREMFYSATRLTSLVAFPAFLGVFALVPELVPTLFGQQWAPSIPVMQVLTFIGLLHTVLFFQYTVMAGVGKPSWYLGLQVMITVANVIGFLIAVRWGIVAVAISYVIVAYLFAPLSVWLVYRLIQIDLLKYLRLFLPAATGSLVMLAFIFSLKFSLSNLVPLQLLLPSCILMSALAYVFTIRLAAPSLAYQALDLLRSALQGR